jgi:hypothetical protein
VRRFLRRFRAWLALVLLRLLRRFAHLAPRLRLPGWFPLSGDIDGHTWAQPVVINDRRFGRSMTIPAILEIVVDGTSGTTIPKVLSPVARRLFAGYQPFTFNVAFSCGRSRALRPGVYGNPRSPWFNIFVGYYEIDVAQSLWGRPFGYQPDGHSGFKLKLGDIERLGEADWNYFSNYMYGVPLSAIEAADQVDVELIALSRREIAGRLWDHIVGSGTKVSTAYVSKGDEGALADNDYVLNDIWRSAFGLPFTGKTPPASFFPASMGAELFACYVASESDRDLGVPVYRTFIFGGTVNEWWAADVDSQRRRQHNEDFLKLQLDTVEHLIISDFAHLGFDLTTALSVEDTTS